MRALISTLFPAVFLAACGGSKPSEVPITATTSSAAPPPLASATLTPSAAPAQSAYAFVIGAAGCFRGGMWAEAEGDDKREERKAAVQARCADVAKTLSGKDDPANVERLRALDPAFTDLIPAKIAALAKEDRLEQAKTEALTKFASTVVTAERETLLSRRAAEKIKGDIAKLTNDKDREAALEKDADKLSADESAAIGQLKPTNALESLMKLDAGDYTHDARAIALLISMNRIDAARGLPKHMKPYATGGVYNLVFGVPALSLPENANAKLKPGTWLAYLSDVAKAAGHPVADTVKLPKEREPLAWSGVLAGFADKLKAEQPQTQGELSNMLIVTIARLETKSETAVEKAHDSKSGEKPAIKATPKAAAGDKDKPKK